MAGGCGPSDLGRGGTRSDDAPQRRIADLWRRLLVLFCFERHRGASGRTQSRLWPYRAKTLVDAEASVTGDCADWGDRSVGAGRSRRPRAVDSGSSFGLLSVG